jgi:transcription termination/antitermination protein NusG
MPFYAIQVWTGDESRFLMVAQRKLKEDAQKLYWPRRSLRIKRAGVWRESLAPIFPSYVFLQADAVDATLFSLLRGAPGFIRFLLSNENIVPMEKKDQDLLSHFLFFGEVVEKSVAYFDANKRIRIVSGPLKDLEGMIVSVDRRKGRARVRLEMYQDSFEVDFGFQALEAAPAAPKDGEPPPKS